MKRSAYIFVFCMAFGISSGQNLYNIKGEPVEIAGKSVVICYSTNICHACMISLVDYCQNLSLQHPDVNFYVLIKGIPSISAMREQTTALYDYFNRDELPDILYDLNPKERKRYFNRYRMKHFPAMMLFSSEKDKHVYIPYGKLFEDTEHSIIVSEYTKNKIHKIFGISGQ